MKSKNSKLKLASLALMSAPLLFTSCFEDAEPDGIIGGNGLVPAVISFEPQTAEPGDPVTITGKDLETTNSVLFNGASAEIVSTSGNSVTVIVPQTATTGAIRLETDNGINQFKESFTVFIDGAPIITEINPASVQAGERVTLKGSLLNAVSAINIGGVAATDLAIASGEVSFTVGEDTPFGETAIEITSSVGISSTDINETPFFVYEVLDVLSETFDNNENVLSHGNDAEIDIKGLNTEIDATTAPFVPEAFDGAFYYVSGTSDTSDSGSFSGQIGSSEQPRGTYADFFNDEASQDIRNIYFNVTINFGDVPADGNGDDLAGLRFRFDEGYDIDSDGSTGDELMEFRPTLSNLAEKGFVPNENGWYSISIRLDEFLNSGPSGNAGSWDIYQVEDLTRIAVASRREYNGVYSMSIDNVSITKGGPVHVRNK